MALAVDTNTSLATNQGLAKYLNMRFFELLHDIGDLKEICDYQEFTPGAGSATMKLRFLQPVDAMTAPGEATAPSFTTWTGSTADVTVAKANLYRGVDDLALITGEMDVEQIVKSFAKSLVYHRSTLIAALGAGFTANTAVGTTTVPLSVDTVYAAMFALVKAKALKPYDLVVHQVGLTQFQDSLRSETATPVATAVSTQKNIEALGLGEVIDFMGIKIRAHASVPKINANADYSNFMVGRSAIFFTEAPVQNFIAKYAFNPQTLAGENAVICQDGSTESSGVRAWICHYYPGVSEGIDAAGVQVVGSV